MFVPHTAFSFCLGAIENRHRLLVLCVIPSFVRYSYKIKKCLAAGRRTRPTFLGGVHKSGKGCSFSLQPLPTA